MKPGFFRKLLERIDQLNPAEIQTYLINLLEEKGFLEKTFEALHEGIILLDIQGEVTYINPAACRFFGILSENVIGANLSHSFGDNNWKEQLLNGGSITRDYQIQYPETRHLNFYFTTIDQNPPLGFVILIHDITETRKIAEENVENERINTLTMMAASVAHELGNPLNSLTIHLQLLEKKLQNHPKALQTIQPTLQITKNEIKRLDTIIERFLRAARPTPPNLKPSNLIHIIQNTIEFLTPELQDREITTTLPNPQHPITLPIDEEQIKQALYNLIRNAMQAIGHNGTITITATRHNQKITLSIHDTGPGIPDTIMSQLFQPWQTSKLKGSGIGLLIVRRIIRDHRGELEILSSPHTGTTINLHLPTGIPNTLLLNHQTHTPH